MAIDQQTRAVIEDCARLSHAGELDFGSVVGRLMAAGVESYHADYRRAETTYYLPSGTSHVLALPQPEVTLADGFDAGAVQAAVRGAQAGRVKYPEFLQLTRQAGCVGYMVWIAGRQVQYYGRRGEVHVEHFPR